MTDHPFESIESAQEFMELLLATIDETVADVERDRETAVAESDERRVQALEMALYKLRLLDGHTQKSRRILNDLRTLRRLLFSERTMTALSTGK
jgi:hypothetical protein